MSNSEYRSDQGQSSKLYKDRENAVIMGVCAGLADYFDTSLAVTVGATATAATDTLTKPSA